MVTFDGGGLVHGSVVSAGSGITFNVTNLGAGPNLGVVFDTERASDPMTATCCVSERAPGRTRARGRRAAWLRVRCSARP